MNKLSLITINYNNVVGLKKTLDSILNQTTKNYEIIVIDGQSKDGSVELIKKYANFITFWISEPDNGIYHAMNKGIREATGDYCFFLNSGDYLVDKTILEKVIKINPTEDVIFGNLYVTVNDKIVGKALGKESLSFIDIYANTIKHQASFIKRDLFKRFGLYNEKRRIVADWEFFIKTIGLNNVSCRYIDKYISFFDNNGISNHNESIIRNERNQIIQENIPLMMQKDYEFLNRYRKYLKLFENRISFFLLRIITKIMF